MGRALFVVASVGLAALAAGTVIAQPAKRGAAAPAAAAPAPAGGGGGTARYDMRAGTVSGVGAQGGRGGGMGMMMGGGGGNAVQHELLLRLGSGRAAQPGAPRADHFMPPAAQLGRSVQLVSPREERGFTDELPQKPKGRMLIYWGCGANAPKGQPVVIDFSRLAAGQVPPDLWSTTVVRDWGPNATNSRSFARWPAEDGKYVRSDSSLPGPHRIASNYAPEISFTLANDFMQPLRSRTMNLPGGAKNLMWTGVPMATGYVASLFGGSMNDRGEMGDMVMWSSSATRQFGGGLADWLSPGQVAGLVRDRTVLPPTATSCTIPAEVIRDAGQFRMGTLTAFGPEENFAYPPRPAGARAYVPDWTARIRHRSTTSWMDMAGMGGMSGMGGGQDRYSDDEDEDRPAPPRNCTPRRGGLGGVLGGLGGLGGGRQPGC